MRSAGRTTLAPLEAEAALRLRTWLPKLHYPIRVGEHSQTAFAFGLVHDWARVTGDADMQRLVETAVAGVLRQGRELPARLRAIGRGLPFAVPRGGRPDAPLAAACRITRSGCVASCPAFHGQRSAAWLPPGVVTDRTDPKLAHIDGLNLSRAWMLRGHGERPAAVRQAHRRTHRCRRRARRGGLAGGRPANITKAAIGSARSRST